MHQKIRAVSIAIHVKKGPAVPYHEHAALNTSCNEHDYIWTLIPIVYLASILLGAEHR
jgi:hypothetical protein